MPLPVRSMLCMTCGGSSPPFFIPILWWGLYGTGCMGIWTVMAYVHLESLRDGRMSGLQVIDEIRKYLYIALDRISDLQGKR